MTATVRRTRLEIAKEHAEPLLGRRAANRLATFENGDLYVEAGVLARTLAWLIDFVVFALGVVVTIGVLAGATSSADLSDDVITILVITTLFVVPILYGLFYRNGRALGALLTGTQLVRLSDGSRIGAKSCWAMLLRTVLLPFMLIVYLVGALGGTFGSMPGSPARTSIDRGATRRLHTLDLPEH